VCALDGVGGFLTLKNKTREMRVCARRGGLFAPRRGNEAGEFALETGGGSGAVPTCRSAYLEESDKGVGDAL